MLSGSAVSRSGQERSYEIILVRRGSTRAPITRRSRTGKSATVLAERPRPADISRTSRTAGNGGIKSRADEPRGQRLGERWTRNGAPSEQDSGGAAHTLGTVSQAPSALHTTLGDRRWKIQPKPGMRNLATRACGQRRSTGLRDGGSWSGTTSAPTTWSKWTAGRH